MGDTQRGGATSQGPAKRERTTTTVSLPTETLAWIDWWVEEHGAELHYRNRVDFIMAAIRAQKDQDEERVLRGRIVEQEDEGLDWDDKERRR